VRRLHDLGWIENRTVAIDYRWAEGRDERFTEISAEFVRLGVDVILTYTNPAALAAKQATAVIPIVFAGAGDPIGTGLVASLARPGGNVTGLSTQQTDLASKRLEMLREILPGLHTLAILADRGSPNSVLEMGEARAAARTLDIAVVTSEVQRAEDIVPAFDALKGRADALYVCNSPTLITNRIRVNSLALGARLPTMHGLREHTVAGGLMSYGANQPSLFRRAAEYMSTRFCVGRSLTTCRSSNRRALAARRLHAARGHLQQHDATSRWFPASCARRWCSKCTHPWRPIRCLS